MEIGLLSNYHHIRTYAYVSMCWFSNADKIPITILNLAKIGKSRIPTSKVHTQTSGVLYPITTLTFT